jgi:hypothetical protein
MRAASRDGAREQNEPRSSVDSNTGRQRCDMKPIATPFLGRGVFISSVEFFGEQPLVGEARFIRFYLKMDTTAARRNWLNTRN